jgi:hypothetical protein
MTPMCLNRLRCCKESRSGAGGGGGAARASGVSLSRGGANQAGRAFCGTAAAELRRKKVPWEFHKRENPRLLVTIRDDAASKLIWLAPAE